MEPSPHLIDQVFLDKVTSAKAMTEEQRFLAGPELFDFACEWTKAGIRDMNPNADDAKVLELLRKRIALGEKLELSR
ncbi:hypothetical protein [Humisphaera borealis]|uniref:Uncharacterized protein n=1 Tax=Humisphaera borealis TaxID=2807512 RepID=A0A7M2X1R8_9BACT|nr:hypothetical protein [Humisphaera borealis]QOV90680.1 hypothetical protein IPV69_04795 [Humisphaera borealis]